MSELSDADVRDVLRHFAMQGTLAHSLGNRGGFSGARIWRVATSQGEFCLKAWPPDGMTPDRHRDIARLLHDARLGGLTFIPAISDHFEYSGRIWDLADWMPGVADFHANPSPDRIRAACTALARLHLAWQRFASPEQQCPAVIRRLETTQKRSDTLVRELVNPNQSFESLTSQLAPLAVRAKAILSTRLPTIPRMLDRWRVVRVAIQPCLCDIRHDHVLFTGDEVTGFVDFGAVKADNVAVDLARLLGDLAGNDAELYESGLDAYSGLRPLTALERQLVPVLDRTGVILGLANWISGLPDRMPNSDDCKAIVQRVTELVQRVEGWASVARQADEFELEYDTSA